MQRCARTSAVAPVTAPHVSGALTGSRSVAFQGATALAAIAALWSVWTRRWLTARLAAALQVSLILWGWVLVQYPFVVPPTLTSRAHLLQNDHPATNRSESW